MYMLSSTLIPMFLDLAVSLYVSDQRLKRGMVCSVQFSVEVIGDYPVQIAVSEDEYISSLVFVTNVFNRPQESEEPSLEHTVMIW